ncbi:MAG: hypothetical protein ACLQIQ_14105 [Beijerinckiaceae bacterium]
MSRNDFILLAVFVSTLSAIVLVAFAPVGDEATLTMRVWAIAGSPISIAVVSTFIAAFAGTWGAQVLAERTANRRALLSEIRGTNAALGLVFTIANTYITTKKQLIRDLVQDYEAQAAARQAHYAGVGRGAPFAYRLELQTIAPPFSPIDELRQMLREKITPDGKALILLTPLVQSIQSFADTAIQRNAWIAEVRAMPEDSDAIKSALFFGLPYAPGRTDDRYPKFINALKLQTDDCIAFSILIGQSLVSYGERLMTRYGEGAPKISRANFDKAGDLLPDMAFYADWMKN